MPLCGHPQIPSDYTESAVPARDVSNLFTGRACRAATLTSITILRYAALSAALCLAAVAQGPAHAERATRSNTDTSVYSTLDEKACTTQKPAGDAPSSEQLCPGYAGYKLKVLDEDVRITVTVVRPDGRQSPLNFSQTVTPYFSSLGPRAEWRVRTTNGLAAPVALTIRLDVKDDPANPAKTTSLLVITRVDAQHICPVKIIRSSPSALDEARKIADRAGEMVCLGPSSP